MGDFELGGYDDLTDGLDLDHIDADDDVSFGYPGNGPTLDSLATNMEMTDYGWKRID